MAGATTEPGSHHDHDAIPDVPDYPPEQISVARDAAVEKEKAWREWMMLGIGITALVSMLAIIFAIAAISETSKSSTSMPAASTKTATTGATNPAFAPAPTLAQAKGMPYERFQPVNATLPAVPSGSVKKFTVGVMEHITQVDPKLAPIQAWTYTVNGVAYRGTAASPPMVVEQGDHVQITFVNGASKAMGVDMAHSIDFHAAHLPPNKYYVDIAPGKSETFSFTAQYAGVFMYHCATQPILTHTGSGMTGMMVVKPRNLAPAARELWITQQEFYIGQPGGIADQPKLLAENPDVVAFNGYANQYKLDPISAPVDRPIRIWILNAGPSRWSAFHVIGTLFDTTDIEGVVGHGSQTVSLAPSQGGWVQFTLDEPGNYPFLTHDFGAMVKGAAGMLHTPGVPPPNGAPEAPTGGSSKPVLPSMVKSASSASSSAGMSSAGMSSASESSATSAAPAAKGDVTVTMGEMWVRSNVSSHKAGRVSFAVANQGQMTHRFAIVRAPAKLDAVGTPLASTVLAKSSELAPGTSATVAANLPAGSYELVCIEPGHYAAGQHIPFTATK